MGIDRLKIPQGSLSLPRWGHFPWANAAGIVASPWWFFRALKKLIGFWQFSLVFSWLFMENWVSEALNWSFQNSPLNIHFLWLGNTITTNSAAETMTMCYVIAVVDRKSWPNVFCSGSYKVEFSVPVGLWSLLGPEVFFHPLAGHWQDLSHVVGLRSLLCVCWLVTISAPRGHLSVLIDDLDAYLFKASRKTLSAVC